MRGGVWPIASFELRRRLRAGATVIGVVGFVVLLAVGHYLHWRALPPRPASARLFGYGYILAVIAAFHLGISDDRIRGMDRFLIGNLITPARYVAGKLLGSVIFLAGLGVFTFVVALALSLGDISYAAWYAISFTLVTWLFLPVMLVVELLMETRHGGAVVLVLFFAAVATLTPFYGSLTVGGWLGLQLEHLDFGTLVPLLVRAPIAGVLLVILYPLCRWRLGAGGLRRRWS